MGQQPEQHPSLSEQAEAVQDCADLWQGLSYMTNRLSLLTHSSGEDRLG